MKNIYIASVAAILCILVVIVACDKDEPENSKTDPTTSIVAVNSISLDKSNIELTVGHSSTLSATIAPDNATNKSISWTSSNTSVANVNSSGLVSAVAEGSAIITVTAEDGNKTSTCSVIVKSAVVPVIGVSLDKITAELTAGQTLQLTATIAPDNATNKNILWTSSNTSVANVNSSGLVSAVAEGSAIITVTAEDGNKTSTCSVTVKSAVVPVIGVSLDKTTAELTAGQTLQLAATVTPDNATNKDVIWSSSNTSVATVNKVGIVNAVASGSVIITVRTVDGEKTATCSITINAADVSVTGVSLNKIETALKVGGTMILTAIVTPDNASNKKVTWQSSNTSIATVNSNGVVKAVTAGVANITVTTEDGSKTAS